MIKVILTIFVPYDPLPQVTVSEQKGSIPDTWIATITIEVYISSLKAISTPRQVFQQNLNMRYGTIDARPVFRQGGMN
ncbi:MAG: hypothetical protein EZS28_052124 [Streblomastix strix]|uniref:Uncharacterized protein n=1 Tax=Streblomastix strix TaxID=222440 RepID=A0A5J4SIL1_9EUKA|nr:MAG: hypothetical protein EZS28_052124 [Streblomastix strix]